MIRIVIAECLLSGLLGAIVYRLAYAVLGRRAKAWIVALLTAIALGAGVSGVLDPYLLREFAAKSSSCHLACWLVQTLRTAVYLFGAFVADRVVKKRESLGLTTSLPITPDEAINCAGFSAPAQIRGWKWAPGPCFDERK